MGPRGERFGQAPGAGEGEAVLPRGRGQSFNVGLPGRFGEYRGGRV